MKDKRKHDLRNALIIGDARCKNENDVARRCFSKCLELFAEASCSFVVVVVSARSLPVAMAAAVVDVVASEKNHPFRLLCNKRLTTGYFVSLSAAGAHYKTTTREK